MRASRTFVPSLILLAAVVWALPAPAAAHRCGSIGTVELVGMEYGQAQPYLFVTPEGVDESFTIKVGGDTCEDETGNVFYDTPPVTATPGNDPPADYQRVQGSFEFTVQSVHQTFTHPVTVPVHQDTATEAAAETLNVDVRASGNPTPRVGTPRVPMFIVDNEGPARARFALPQPVSWGEFAGTFRIPVLGAGTSPPSGVRYEITPHTTDFSGPSSGPVSFDSDRLGTIMFTPVNDTIEEGPETFTVTLSGATIEGPDTFTITIPASDAGGGDSVAPRAWFHHPKHRERYRQGSPGADTIHLFADDNSGHQQVTSAQLALRKKMTNGNCKYWKGGSWGAGACSSPKWFAATTRYADGGKWLYIYTDYPSLRPSVGTRIATYTVYGRATDASGNRSPLQTGENRNTFEVTRR